MADVGVKAVSHESLGYTGTYRGRALDAQVFIFMLAAHLALSWFYRSSYSELLKLT